MNKILKKLTLVTSMALLIGLLGCSSKEKETKKDHTSTENDEKTVLVKNDNEKSKPKVSSTKPTESKPIAELEPVPDAHKHSDIKIVPIGRPLESDKKDSLEDDRKDKDDDS